MKNAETYIPGPIVGSCLFMPTSAIEGSSPAQLSELRAQPREQRPTRSRRHRAATRRRLSLGLRRLAYRT
jgi:hypothetical protein